MEEDGTIQGMNLDTKIYTDKLDISVSGTTPTGGYLNYENNVLKNGCLTMNEYKVIIEDGEVTEAEKGTCESISLTACDSVNFNPSPEEWFNFDSSTGTITGLSDTWNEITDPKKTDITIPCQIGEDAVVNVGNDTTYMGIFDGKGLTSVTLNDNILTIGIAAFYRNELESVFIPNNVEAIGMSAFSYNKLTNLVIGDKVSTIGDAAFMYNKLERIRIPGNVETLKSQVFQENALSVLNIEEGVKTIGTACFQSNKLSEVSIPNTVTTIGVGSFNENIITKLTLGEKVEIIDSGAFANNNLTEVTIPSSVITINNGAFGKSNSNNIPSNINLTTIYNNTGKKFDWGLIINGTSGYFDEEVTVENQYGNVEVVKSN